MKSDPKEDLLDQAEIMKFQSSRKNWHGHIGHLVIPAGLHDCLTACSSTLEKQRHVETMQLPSSTLSSAWLSMPATSSSSWGLLAASTKASTQELTSSKLSCTSGNAARASSTIHLRFLKDVLFLQSSSPGGTWQRSILWWKGSAEHPSRNVGNDRIPEEGLHNLKVDSKNLSWEKKWRERFPREAQAMQGRWRPGDNSCRSCLASNRNRTAPAFPPTPKYSNWTQRAQGTKKTLLLCSFGHLTNILWFQSFWINLKFKTPRPICFWFPNIFLEM